MVGSYTLSGVEKANSNAQGWVTQSHELRMYAQAPASNIIGTPSASLYAMNGGTNATAGTTIPISSFGLRLAPNATSIPGNKISKVWTERDPVAVTQPFAQVSSVAQVRLDPGVRLVPIRMIVLCDPDGIPPQGEAAFPCGIFKRYQAETILDQMNLPNIQRTRDSFSDPLQVVGSWAYVQNESKLNSPGRAASLTPDRIFYDCNIQFRLTHFVECPSTDEAVYATSCEDTFTEPGQAITGADNCAAAQGPGARVIINSRLSSLGMGCSPVTLGITIAHKDVVMSIGGMASPAAFSHELGHALDLDHWPTADNLMYDKTISPPGTSLTTSQCSTAFQKAKTLQSSVWP
jgi:hypothetical protein